MYNQVPAGAETGMGSGHQRRYQLGALAYDRSGGFLYVTELFGDVEVEQLLIHVWQVQE